MAKIAVFGVFPCKISIKWSIFKISKIQKFKLLVHMSGGSGANLSKIGQKIATPDTFCIKYPKVQDRESSI